MSAQGNIQIRRRRNRYQLKLRADGKPRLSVHRSNKNLYAQVIDDAKAVTIASFSTCDPALRKDLKNKANKEAADRLGKEIASRALAAGVSQVVFDRGAYVYHGCVKAIADAAREAGLKF